MLRGLVMALALLASSSVTAQQTEEAWRIVRSQSQVETFGQSLGATEQSAARPINRVTLQLIKTFEGWVPTAYDDPAGYCSIGYGHLIDLKRCELTNLGEFAGRLSPEAGETLLQRDTVAARLTVQRAVRVDLNDNQFGALVSFVFNVGSEKFQSSTLLRVLNLGDYRAAQIELMRWVKARGVLIDGLVQRRKCEVALFRGQLALRRGGSFDRTACDGSLGAADAVASPIDIFVGE